MFISKKKSKQAKKKCTISDLLLQLGGTWQIDQRPMQSAELVGERPMWVVRAYAELLAGVHIFSYSTFCMAREAEYVLENASTLVAASSDGCATSDSDAYRQVAHPDGSE
jgi:hypothetical protein